MCLLACAHTIFMYMRNLQAPQLLKGRYDGTTHIESGKSDQERTSSIFSKNSPIGITREGRFRGTVGLRTCSPWQVPRPLEDPLRKLQHLSRPRSNATLAQRPLLMTRIYSPTPLFLTLAHLFPEEIEEFLGNPTRSIHSFFSELEKIKSLTIPPPFYF